MGSVQKRTIDEIKQINEFGQIIIGTEATTVVESPAEIIVVEVRDASGNTKTYNFQELQDLVSRIVLITGKSRSDDLIGMNKFLEVSLRIIIIKHT